jgi:SAM-dependent methyltransferase
MRPNDLVYFSVLLSDANQEEIVAQYKNQIVEEMTFTTAKLVGITPENAIYDAGLNPITKDIECAVTITRLTEEMQDNGVRLGDRVVVIKSHKPTLQKFKEIAGKYFEGQFLFDESGTFVAFFGRKKSVLGEASAHYTADNYKSVEESKDKNLQRYMAEEADAIACGIRSPETKTFVDLGAGYGRVIPKVSRKARNVVAIELNPSMFAGLEARAKALPNVDAVFSDVMNLSEILSTRDVINPVIMLLQNTLAVIGGVGNMNAQYELLTRMRDAAMKYKGEIVISLLKQEALEEMGVPMYRDFPFAGEVDLEKSDFNQGIFTAKTTGYQSKWWKPEERESIRRILGGTIVKEYEEGNFYILHLSYA